MTLVAYEFSTHVTEDEAVVIPPEYANKLPKGAPVRVILLVEEPVHPRKINAAMPVNSTSLEVVVAEIKQLGPNPQNIKPGRGQLAEKLANPLTELDPSFDLAAWTYEWDRIEAEMKANSLVHEEAERHEWLDEPVST